MSDDLGRSQVHAGYREILERAGYVVIKAKSYRAAQERQRIAECQMRCAEEDATHARAWAINCLDEERRLGDRLTFVYGVARAHGATIEELSGEQP
jgi:hypothetical protein